MTSNGLTAYSYQPFIITFPGNHLSFDSTSFNTRVDVSASANPPYGMTTSDLDGDGKPDLIAALNSAYGKVSVFRNLSSPGQVILDNRIDLAAGTYSYKVAVGDLNGDGKPDIAVTNSYNGFVGNCISVYKNKSTTGNILFTDAVNYACTAPRGIAIGDLDGDGKPDIVITYGNGVSFFRNTSTTDSISFAARTDYAAIGSSEDVLIGDLDGDGKPDLTLSSYWGGAFIKNISTVGAISFTGFTELNGVGIQPTAAALADIDGDGKFDILIPDRGGNTTGIYRNTSVPGTISFASRVDIYTATYCTGITVSDFDGDGRTDMAVSNYSDDIVSLLKNESSPGTILFGSKVTLKTGDAPQMALAGDIDMDGKPEIFTSNSFSKNISILRNKVNEPLIYSFSPVTGSNGTVVTIKGKNFTGATGVSFGGVNAASFSVFNDTILLATVGNGATGNVSVISAAGAGSLAGFVFADPLIDSITPLHANQGTTVTIYGKNFTGATAVRFGNINAASFVVDSSQSITAIVGSGASGNCSVTTSYGTASLPGFVFNSLLPVINSFSPAGAVAGTTITIRGHKFTGANAVNIGAVAASSFIVLNDSTITAVLNTSASGKVTVSTPEGTASLAGFTYMTGPPVVGTWSNMGIPGSVVTLSGSNFSSIPSNNTVYLGEVKATVIAATETSLTVIIPPGASNSKPVTVTSGNLTGYGFRFVINFPVNISVINEMSFANQLSLSTGDGPGGLATGDFDGDGRADIAVANYGTTGTGNTISILRNTGKRDTISFGNKIDFVAGTAPKEITAGDFDGDGKLDIAVANYASNTISIFRNLSSPGNISFAPKIDLATGLGPESLGLADFDGDGKTDIAVANFFSNTFSIFKNTGLGSISFAAKTDFNTRINPHGLTISDADYNYKPDILLVDEEWNVFYNNSTASSLLFDGYSAPNSNIPSKSIVMMEDINNADYPDLIIANRYPGNKNIYGIGGFENHQWGNAVASAYSNNANRLAITDLDCKGIRDVIVANKEGKVSVLENIGAYGTPPQYPIILDSAVEFPVPGNSFGIGTCDFDGDGKPDIVVSNFNTNTVSVLRNRIYEFFGGCPGFQNHTLYTNLQEPTTVGR
ncbi:MAG: VCBS repeat-containing protein [Chitinophagaceae bacterium]|nr:VCBS repeat-containing protein [Chitinophagaceae bacterium]